MLALIESFLLVAKLSLDLFIGGLSEIESLVIGATRLWVKVVEFVVVIDLYIISEI